MRASKGPNALLSGAKTWTRRRKIRGSPVRPRGPIAHSPLFLLARSRQMNHTWTYFHSHTSGSSKREVINHRAINNQYFSSNVYRVRFKCLVKTNLRPYDGGLRPFCLAPLPPRLCPSGEYISRPNTDVNSLPDPSRNLAFGWQGRAKVKERKWLPHMETILYTRVCLERD